MRGPAAPPHPRIYQVLPPPGGICVVFKSDKHKNVPVSHVRWPWGCVISLAGGFSC